MWYNVPITKFEFKSPPEINQSDFKFLNETITFNKSNSIKPKLNIWFNLKFHFKINLLFILSVAFLSFISWLTESTFSDFSFWVAMAAFYMFFLLILLQIILIITYHSFFILFLDHRRYYKFLKSDIIKSENFDTFQLIRNKRRLSLKLY